MFPNVLMLGIFYLVLIVPFLWLMRPAQMVMPY